MWMGQRVYADAALYNMIFTHRLTSRINVAAFQRAFEALLVACPILRTVIRERNGEPRQVVTDIASQALALVDLADEIDPDAALERWVENRRAQVLPMSERLYDSALLRVGDEAFVWYFNLHHLITDVTSTRLIYGVMSDLYVQCISGATLTLPELPSYQMYVAHEQTVRRTPAFAEASDYWQHQLALPTDPLSFYGEHSTADSTRTERHEFPLSEARAAALAQLAERPGIRSFSRDLTYANLFGALILAFLHRLHGNETIRLGSPFANRSTPALRQTLGAIIEVLSLTVNFDPDETFASLVKKVMTANLQALRHVLPGVGTAEHNRAYEVLLNFITVSFPPFAGLPTRTEWVHAGYGDSNHKLRLQAYDFDGVGRYTLAFDFNTQVFNDADRARALDHFGRVMDACLAMPDLPLHQIRLQTDDEWQTLVRDFNATTRAYPASDTVISLFEAQVERTPDAIALQLGTRTLTYADLNQRANALANDLIRAGVGADTLVPICMAHSTALIVALLAILKAGGAYVPLDPDHPDQRLAGMLEDIGEVPAMVVDAGAGERFAHYRTRLFVVTDAPAAQPTANPMRRAEPQHLAYMIFTSGTTGRPKGVLIAHRGLTNYLWWAQQQYTEGRQKTFALHSSLAFDLTVTSIFVPLITGGSVRIYPDTEKNGMVIREVFRDNAVDVVKLTPSHLALVRDLDLATSRIRTLIVGGEDFKTDLAKTIHRLSNGRMTQFNEYGPTEATVACMIHRYVPAQDVRASVPIGKPSDNMRVYVLDRRLQSVPTGVIGEMYVAGVNVARGYLNRAALTAERFLADPFVPDERMYRTGDVARWLPNGQLEFLGRNDHQVKVGGVRIELAEIEAALLTHPAITEVVVDVRAAKSAQPTTPPPNSLTYCTRCGLSSAFPGVTFAADGVCNVCRDFDTYRDKAQRYFKDMGELHRIAKRIKANRKGDYDCVALFSGGKDSTYMLYSLVEALGLRVLAFTLDNGYLSDDAKANIRRVTAALKVDHVFGETPFMKTIFVDSLKRYANVCNGCFKTIYTLAMKLAREKGIRTIFTGLSRGQFFETRLTPELFVRDDFDVSAIDESIERARLAYHQRDDLISRSLDVDVFRAEQALQQIEFVDFYRYSDVDLSDVYRFLSERGLWTRPTDTGRSTNCLINEVGIALHQQKRGFHNYALPYSWDVRMGHKTRQEALDELNDEIDPTRVQRILREIGYHDDTPANDGQPRLVAFVVATQPLTTADVRAHLSATLADYMIPTQVVQLAKMPLAPSGKVNRAALPDVEATRAGVASAYVLPRSDVEAALVAIWQTIMGIPQIGVHDDFFELGGHSLPAIRIVSQINAVYDIDFPLDHFFNHPTIAQIAIVIDDMLMAEIAAMSDDDVQQQLAGNG
jgi:amino acid adenylation domain-containing protein